MYPDFGMCKSGKSSLVGKYGAVCINCQHSDIGAVNISFDKLPKSRMQKGFTTQKTDFADGIENPKKAVQGVPILGKVYIRRMLKKRNQGRAVPASHGAPFGNHDLDVLGAEGLLFHGRKNGKLVAPLAYQNFLCTVRKGAGRIIQVQEGADMKKVGAAGVTYLLQCFFQIIFEGNNDGGFPMAAQLF